MLIKQLHCLEVLLVLFFTHSTLSTVMEAAKFSDKYYKKLDSWKFWPFKSIINACPNYLSTE